MSHSSKSQPPRKSDPKATKEAPKSKANLNKAPTYAKDYKSLKNIPDDARFGDILLIRDPKDKDGLKTLFIKEKTVNTQKEASRDVCIVQDRLQLNHPHIQTLFDWASVTQADWCSTFYQIR
jgi:hypothetical protein